MAESTSSKAYSSDPTLWLYTSLSSGSSQIVTATSRLETILKANRIPFKALDVATDEKARMLWGRRAGKRKLPGLVRMGMVIGDIDEIEEWNEYGELKEQVGADTAPATRSTQTTTTKGPTTTSTASNPVPIAPPLPATETAGVIPKAPVAQAASTKPASSISFAPEKPRSEQTNTGGGIGGAQTSMSLAMRQLGQEAAARAKQNKSDTLSARKAQIAAAEKPASSIDIPLSSEVPNATSSTAPESVQPGTTSTAKQLPTETDTEDNALADTLDGALDSKPHTSSSTENADASGIEAVGPESPLPTTEESMAKPQDTTLVQSQSIKSSESVVSDSSIPVSLHNLTSSNTAYTTHRGSSISAASKEEIKAIEEANKIPEEPEEDEPNAQADKQKESIPVQKHSEEKNENVHEQNTAKAEEQSVVAPSATEGSPVNPTTTKDDSINHVATEHTPSDQPDSKTQDQAAAEPKKATESVED